MAKDGSIAFRRRETCPAQGPRGEGKSAVEAAKTLLGESGPVWWADGAPDEQGLTPPESRYSGWWDALSEDERLKGL